MLSFTDHPPGGNCLPKLSFLRTESRRHSGSGDWLRGRCTSWFLWALARPPVQGSVASCDQHRTEAMWLGHRGSPCRVSPGQAPNLRQEGRQYFPCKYVFEWTFDACLTTIIYHKRNYSLAIYVFDVVLSNCYVIITNFPFDLESLDQLQKCFQLLRENWKLRLEGTSSQEHFSAFTLGVIGNSSFSVTSGTTK